MVSKHYTLSKSIRTLREAVGKKDIPAIWLEFFLMVADAGEQGITTQDLIKEMDLTQGIASRIVKMLGRYHDPKEDKAAGYDLFITAPDHYYRHRQRLFLTDHGKEIAALIAAQIK